MTISFTNNELFYIFVHDKNDPYYFRLILPNVLPIQENRYDVISVPLKWDELNN